MKKATSNKQRKAARKLFPKVARKEQAITPEFIASLPKSR